ncbi:hypothetical protein BKA65DRAFT_480047 [Rhexocercosporidium sp. MPI-PUGE-AT-0058]|nr:hypothetical protein BKA65DRAFT_480047 [Rhexocercosporidium sp. MPI-PUGE-AT-0058]
MTQQRLHELSNRGTSSRGPTHYRDSELPQSMALLPLHYDLFLDLHTAKKDAFYALDRIFHHAACSESQFLNLMQNEIEDEMGILECEERRSCALDNLQYFEYILRRHVSNIRTTLCNLESGIYTSWPKCDTTSGSKRAALAFQRLVMDYKELLYHATNLATQCTQGMSVMMNRSVVAESRKSIEQPERLKKLTLLATSSYLCHSRLLSSA